MPPEPFQCQSTFHCSIILFGSVSLISESQAFSTFTRERNTNPFFPLSIVALDASTLDKKFQWGLLLYQNNPWIKKSGLSAGKWDRISYSFSKKLCPCLLFAPWTPLSFLMETITWTWSLLFIWRRYLLAEPNICCRTAQRTSGKWLLSNLSCQNHSNPLALCFIGRQSDLV